MSEEFERSVKGYIEEGNHKKKLVKERIAR